MLVEPFFIMLKPLLVVPHLGKRVGLFANGDQFVEFSLVCLGVVIIRCLHFFTNVITIVSNSLLLGKTYSFKTEQVVLVFFFPGLVDKVLNEDLGRAHNGKEKVKCFKNSISRFV